MAQPPYGKCPWDKLPTELKLCVFSYLDLIQPEPIKPICYPGRRRIPSKITELSQVSKDFNALFKDIWCKQSTFVVASLGNPLKIIYPNPRLGHLIRNLQLILHLDTDHTSNYDMLYEGAYDGRFIFLTPSRNGNGQDTNATKWTQHFPHLDTLRICVVAHDVRGLNICGHGNSRKDNMMRALKGTKFAIEAKTTTVTASCFEESEGPIFRKRLGELYKPVPHKP
ncbi:hypothetical protein GRF29_216g939124 [Pseudopithomyces chartarum]|uniref:F-box domain-containing protein n=1 Tax=Pseudopithomyces chartarum TaxID=1892770 RepID=A0AAN6LRG0_9PLEO|nr:hypothetical protein GRF29_216g939124 [Pseudopithomyces chartarum]